jgi:hypothetical protein
MRRRVETSTRSLPQEPDECSRSRAPGRPQPSPRAVSRGVVDFRRSVVIHTDGVAGVGQTRKPIGVRSDMPAGVIRGSRARRVGFCGTRVQTSVGRRGACVRPSTASCEPLVWRGRRDHGGRRYPDWRRRRRGSGPGRRRRAWLRCRRGSGPGGRRRAWLRCRRGSGPGGRRRAWLRCRRGSGPGRQPRTRRGRWRRRWTRRGRSRRGHGQSGRRHRVAFGRRRDNNSATRARPPARRDQGVYEDP